MVESKGDRSNVVCATCSDEDKVSQKLVKEGRRIPVTYVIQYFSLQSFRKDVNFTLLSSFRWKYFIMPVLLIEILINFSNEDRAFASRFLARLVCPFRF
jgi:hypothetical protein